MRPKAFSCAKRAADPSNKFAACRQWCGDPRQCVAVAALPEWEGPRWSHLTRAIWHLLSIDERDLSRLGISEHLKALTAIRDALHACARGIDSGEAGETRSSSTPQGQEPGPEGTRPSPASPAVPQGEREAMAAEEADAVVLWAEIHRLREAVKGPAGFASWQDAAVAERIRRVDAERRLAAATPPEAEGVMPSIDEVFKAMSEREPGWNRYGASRESAVSLAYAVIRAAIDASRRRAGS